MQFRQIMILLFGLVVLMANAFVWVVHGGVWTIVLALCGVALVLTATFMIVAPTLLKAGGGKEKSVSADGDSPGTDDLDARLQAKIKALGERARLSEQGRPEPLLVEPERPAPEPENLAPEPVWQEDQPSVPHAEAEPFAQEEQLFVPDADAGSFVEEEQLSAPDADAETFAQEEQLSAPQDEAESFAALLSALARPALALVRPYPPVGIPAVRSHVGGLPDLPVDEAWPRAIDGSGCIPANAPLHFLGQIDLAEQPWLPSDFPDTGTVMFFGALTDGYYWGTQNDARVIYDPDSCGIPTLPPEDLEGIDGGYGRYQKTFGDDDWLRCQIFPEWPLIGKRIETMPDGNALAVNSYHDEKYAGYHEALNDFRAEQAALAADIDLSDAARLGPSPTISLLDEPGFPWTARYVALWGRMVRRTCPDDLKESVSQLIEWADSCDVAAPIAADKAAGFKEMLSTWPRSGGALPPGVDSASPVFRRLIREAGGNRHLAQLLPEALYAYAQDEHLPVRLKRGGSGGRKDGKPAWDVRHHQMGGHVPSSQEPVPLDYDRVCLAQFQSDSGVEMVLCDLGEADFWIRPSDLADADFADVLADTRGG